MGSLRSLRSQEKCERRNDPTDELRGTPVPRFRLGNQLYEFEIDTGLGRVYFGMEEKKTSRLISFLTSKRYQIKVRIALGILSYSDTGISLIYASTRDNIEWARIVLKGWKREVRRNPSRWKEITQFSNGWFFKFPHLDKVWRPHLATAI